MITPAIARALAVTIILAIALVGPAAPLPARADGLRLLVLGDSLTAGYGLPRAAAFPAQLERALQEQGLAVAVIDAGVSGDTSAGGLARLDWVLAGAVPGGRPDLAIVELGGNDVLRGFAPETTFANLDAILARLRARDIPVLLAGMRAPPNLGQEYAAAFDAVYPRLAAKHEVALYPFFLEGVAGQPALNQPDGIHPNAQGVARIVAGITPEVVRLLQARQAPPR